MSKGTDKKSRRALVTGSFDPITKGHEDVIRRAAEEYGEVYAVVFASHEKKGFFSFEQRLVLLKAVCKKFKNVKADLSLGYVADYAKEIAADAIVRGVRDESDIAYEEPMAKYNFEHSGVKTVFFQAPDELKEVSSSRVRELLLAGKDPSALLPKEIAKEICENWRIFRTECD